MARKGKRARYRQSSSGKSASWGGGLVFIRDDVGLLAEPGVRRAGRKTVYLNAWSNSLGLAVLAILIVALLGLLAYALAGMAWPENAARWAALATVLLGLKCSEAWWFGLTCRRFAAVDGRQLVLYGAFGRERFRCGLNRRFEYDGGRLYVWDAAGGARGFGLALCRNRYALLDRLDAEVGDGRMEERWRYRAARLKEKHPLRSRLLGLLLLAQFVLVWLPVVWMVWTGALLSLQLLPPAWYAGGGLMVLWLLPAVWLARSELGMRLPENLAPRPWQRWRALLLWSAVLMICVYVHAEFAGRLSLLGQPFRAVAAREVSASGTCVWMRDSRVPRVLVRLPAEDSAFDGEWCSRWTDDVELLGAGSTVYLRGSDFARELRFRRP